MLFSHTRGFTLPQPGHIFLLFHEERGVRRPLPRDEEKLGGWGRCSQSLCSVFFPRNKTRNEGRHETMTATVDSRTEYRHSEMGSALSRLEIPLGVSVESVSTARMIEKTMTMTASEKATAKPAFWRLLM